MTLKDSQGNQPFFDVTSVTVGDPRFVLPELLFCPSIPETLVGVNPRTIMGPAWWDKERRRAYAKNRGCCWACGSREGPLEGHEIYQYWPSENRVVYSECAALCPMCHGAVHLDSLLQGKIPPDEQMQHTINVLTVMNHKRGLKLLAVTERRDEIDILIKRLLPEGRDKPLEFKPGVKWFIGGKEIS